MRRARLAEARKAAGKSQEDVAEVTGVDRSRVSAWENGHSTPYPQQRGAYASAIGVSLSELASMLSSMPIEAGEIPDWLARYLNAEQSATEIRAHEPEVVYGLLQTPAYVEAVVRCVGLTGVTDDYITQNINQRRHRQQRVKEGSLTLDVIQAEQVLHVRVGGPVVMAEQLHSLAEAAEQDNVTVRITTYDAGQHEARRLDTFLILAHPWGNPTVCLEGYGGMRFITEGDEIGYFIDVFDQAAQLALPAEESVAYIREVARRWEKKR